MACEVFDPELPHGTPQEQTIWLNRWTSNLLNSACLQDMCSTVCLPGHSPLSSACLTCLERQKCSGTLRCLQCLGRNPDTLNDFEPVYRCTVDAVSPVTVTASIIAGVLGFLLLVALVYFLLYKTRQLPHRQRLQVDQTYDEPNEHRASFDEIAANQSQLP